MEGHRTVTDTPGLLSVIEEIEADAVQFYLTEMFALQEMNRLNMPRELVSVHVLPGSEQC